MRVDRGPLLLTGPGEQNAAALDRLVDRKTLVFGCGRRPVDGAVNHDVRRHSDFVDVAFDLDVMPWPIPDTRFEKIVALDVFEHLRADVIDWVRECYRILTSGGLLVMRVSAWDNPVSYRDPTHRRFFHEETFAYFDPRHPLYRDYGTVYWDDCPTFETVTVERGNADARYGVGDICVVLKKVARP